MSLKPFADEATALRLGDLTIENRLDRVSLYGSLDLTRDRAGLGRARELQALLGAVLEVLEREATTLPESVPTEDGDRVRNPFA